MKNDLVFRSAAIKANTFNKESRTFVAVLATGNPIQRRGGYEVLDLASMQLPASAPILLGSPRHRRSHRRHAPKISAAKATPLSATAVSPVIRRWLRCASALPTAPSTASRSAIPCRHGGKAKAASGERTRTAVGAVLRHAALVAEPADSAAGIRSQDDGDDEGNRNG